MPLLSPSQTTSGTSGGVGSTAWWRKPVVEGVAAATRGTIAQRAALQILRLYQLMFSPMFAGSCRFVPSCSAYAAEAISRFGVIRGSRLALGRLARCRPLAPHGFDPVPTGPSPDLAVKLRLKPPPKNDTVDGFAADSTQTGRSSADCDHGGCRGSAGSTGRMRGPSQDCHAGQTGRRRRRSLSSHD